jgi:RND family efflux transporter MFP subunit
MRSHVTWFTVFLSGAALMLAVGCSHEREQLPPEASDSTVNPDAIKVTASPVTLRAVQRYVGLVGTLHAYEETSIGAEVGGRVRKVMHDVSDRVRPGEVLVEIDPTDYQLKVRQAQKELQVELAKLGLSEAPTAKTDVTRIPVVVQARLKRDNAQTRLERAKTLVQRKAAPEEELTERLSESRVAQAEYDNQVLLAKAGIAAILVKQEALAMAEQQLKDTLVHVPAPSQAVPGGEAAVEYAITSRRVAEGEYVMEGAELFKLVIEHPLKFRGRVPERRIGEVSVGQVAKVFVSAFAEPFDGQVVRINPAIDPATRAFEVEILLPNPKRELKPGGFAKTGILTELDDHAVTVPLEALVSTAGVTKIFLIENGHAKEVQVKVGTQETDWVEIEEPRLPDGAQVVTSGQAVIADGTLVELRSTSVGPSAPPVSKVAARPADTSSSATAPPEATP